MRGQVINQSSPPESGPEGRIHRSQAFSMEGLTGLLRGSSGGLPVTTLDVMTAVGPALGEAAGPPRPHSPGGLHLAPQQQCILGRLLLFVVFSFHTDVLDLRFTKKY